MQTERAVQRISERLARFDIRGILTGKLRESRFPRRLQQGDFFLRIDQKTRRYDHAAVKRHRLLPRRIRRNQMQRQQKCIQLICQITDLIELFEPPDLQAENGNRLH